MKKNLLALAAVLMLVAVAARMQRDPERDALERDLQGGLERLWGTTGHQVEFVQASAGLTARVKVALPKQGLPEWSEPFVNFVTARHPKVGLVALEVQPAVNQPPGPRIELLRRQTQALVDGAVGAGNGLVLLSGSEGDQPVQQQEDRQKMMENQAPPMESAPSAHPHGAPRMRIRNSVEPTPSAPATPVISAECLVLGVELPDERLRQLQDQIQAQVPCSQFRVVKLPPL
ncbi:MAG: hypothetical protein U0931_11255 [Vulcanimicrobiota bacterium]